MQRTTLFVIGIFAIILLAVAGYIVWGPHGSGVRDAATEGSSTVDYYTCPMHPSVRSDRPGICPVCGMALVKDGSALQAAMAMTAAYLPSSGVRDPMHYSPDGSRRARAVDVWAAFQHLGRHGVAALVEQCCRHAARIAAALRDAGHQVLNDVELNQVLVAFGDDARTNRIIAAVQAAGVCWCGGTRWQGRDAMRISVSSWATTDADVDQSVTSILKAAASQ